MYTSTFPELLAPLGDYHQGYLRAISDAQSKIYGYYFIDELLTDSLLEELNTTYKKATGADSFHLSREQLSYSIATDITHKERLLLLNLLSKRHQVHLYSNETHPLLKDVFCHGTANYTDEILKIYHASKINLNINLKISQSGMPLRTLDIMGAGGFLLSNYQIELAENYIADEEIVFYTDIQEALDKAAFYLAHDDLRKQIALNGQNKTFEQFNYSRLLEIIFKTAGID